MSIYAKKEIIKNRISICETCKYLFKPTYTCKKCGCFLKIKTTLKNAQCPLGKWNEEQQQWQEIN